MLIAAIVNALPTGYLAGLLSFTVTGRCSHCGATTGEPAGQYPGNLR